MPNFLWTFETETTTGLESDTDTISGIDLRVQTVPIPTVPGYSGNGRLLCSGNFGNTFATLAPLPSGGEAALLHTSGQPLSLSFRWRPLVDYPNFYAGTCMLQYGYLGFISSGNVGNTYILVNILSNATTGLYDFQVVVLGFYVSPTTTTFPGIALTLRGWNELGFSYDGANTITLTVNGATIGTIGPTVFVMPTTTSGQLKFAKDSVISSAVFGVLDNVSFSIS